MGGKKMEAEKSNTDFISPFRVDFALVSIFLPLFF
jgi:hypothetical protein